MPTTYADCHSDENDSTSAVPFHPSEIFFSRTDERGKIIAGNTVFQRVSQYPWGELLAKPHNVIRHPDMPRGVFWLLWDRIKCGKLTGAYVKNRAKDGRHYWVFAIVAPAERGFLSVRIKPTSSIFRIVQKEYAGLLTLEADQALKPAASAALLTERIRALGFDDYDAFMADALTAEMIARSRLTRGIDDSLLECFRVLMERARALIAMSALISSSYTSHQFVPLNLLVQADRLGQAGAAIGTISANYRLLADEIKAGLDEFIKAAAGVAANICQGAFMVGTANVQREAIRAFAKETPFAEVDHYREMASLQSQETAYELAVQKILIGIRGDVERFHHQTQDLKRLASGLSAIRVMGKVESGRLAVPVLADLIADLEAFQGVIASGLAEIGSVNQALRQNVEALANIGRN